MKQDEGWVCPVCGKEHSKPHYAFDGQIDYMIDPDTEGRVLFNRAERYGGLKGDTEYKYQSNETGPAIDKDGYPRGLFCSHCGFEQEIIVIKKK